MFYIKLTTFEPLDSNSLMMWNNTIKEFAPEDAISASITITKTKNSDDGEYYHTVELRRHLYSFETEFIVNAWEAQYLLDFDIEISGEYDPSRQVTDYQISADAVDDIQEQASKFLHNRWVEERTQSGWRYGLKYNLNEQTSPKLMNWDNLPISYRKKIELTEMQAIQFYLQNRNLFT
jgi:hypothetical protein